MLQRLARSVVFLLLINNTSCLTSHNSLDQVLKMQHYAYSEHVSIRVQVCISRLTDTPSGSFPVCPSIETTKLKLPSLQLKQAKSSV
ncbi:uncharacterized protein PHALS_15248 [Plasmopara halstedii]|uniref:RxLR-like protein n=1 Tax=Plasmopara halstedii TaxID=4781 RepID=A0A0P1B6R7_PLAHL|nr:uncharacterized protein PHALS_15248 [Plasmopara halstedii]CEG49964.1 hypothetical protein PHALS_15248 [Plasmopara halstedii]|eukprot:XP_024586333.1 hypothetical protein PHALS_15248 [Plasmopara halstedii]